MRLVTHPAVAALLGLALVAVIVVQGRALLGGELPTVPTATVGVAHDFAVAVTSFDYRRLDDDVDRVLAFGDDGFVEEFRAATGDGFGRDVVDARRVSVGEVVAGPTAHRVTDDRAQVLVVVEQRVASLAEDDRVADAEQVRVAMLLTVEAHDEDPRVLGVELL
jgi:hypothetical protein